jgi:hypothetical protein
MILRKNKKGDLEDVSDYFIELPDGENLKEYGTDKHKYHYFYEKQARVTKDKSTYNKTDKMLVKLYDMVDTAVRENRLELTDFQTVEMIGDKFQKTLGVDKDVAMAVHKDQQIEIPDEQRNYDGIKKFLLEDKCTEGIVIEHKNRYWKIRSNCFDKNCEYEKLSKQWLKDRKNTVIPGNYIGPVIL